MQATEIIKRTATYFVKCDADLALELWNAGQSFKQIRDAIAPGASKTSVVRAINRAVRAGGIKQPHTKGKS